MAARSSTFTNLDAAWEALSAAILTAAGLAADNTAGLFFVAVGITLAADTAARLIARTIRTRHGGTR